MLRGATRVYGISPSSRDSLAAAGGLDGGRVGILPLPVDLDAFAPVPDGSGARPSSARCSCSSDARTTRARTRGLLLERCRCSGANPRRPRAPRRHAAPGPAAGGRRDDRRGRSVAEHVRDASLFVLPSRQEGFGIVAAEALACGVPVLTTPCGGPEELVRASGGGVVLDGFTPEELADAAGELLEAPARLLAMRASGREYVAREHSPDRLRMGLAEAFRELEEG